jgi:hypothetical protein
MGNTEAFEPLTSNLYIRKVGAGDFPVVNQYLYKDLKELGLWNKETIDEIITNNGSIQNINTIPDNFYNNAIGEYFQWNIVNTWINGIDFTYYYGNVTAFTYTALGTNAVDGIYTGLSGVTNGNGVDATFDVEVSGNSVTGISGNTQGKLYICGDTITVSGVLIGGYNNAIDTYSDNIVSQTGATGSYYNGISATGGTGVNATFNVGVDKFGSIEYININKFGSGYTNGDSLVIVGSLFGGTDGVDDITITITALITDNIQISVGVVPVPSVYEGYTCNIFKNSANTDRLSYYDGSDVLVIKNINE